MVEINQEFKDKVLLGRQAVDDYREAHRQLHSKGWYKGIHEAHTPLLDAMKVALEPLGFTPFEKLWESSDLLNIQELGYVSKEDFSTNATEEDKLLLEGKWR